MVLCLKKYSLVFLLSPLFSATDIGVLNKKKMKNCWKKDGIRKQLLFSFKNHPNVSKSQRLTF